MRVTQLEPASAVHPHSGAVVNETVAIPPAASTGVVGAVSATAHFAGVGAVDVTAVDPQADTNSRLVARNADDSVGMVSRERLERTDTRLRLRWWGPINLR